jgi:dCTP deaminase
MAFWGGSKLATDIPAYGMVEPFDADQIDCNAYTLTMGEEYYVTPEFGTLLRSNKKKSLRKKASLEQPFQAIRGRGETFVIPSGQFAFLLTEEKVRIPAFAMGFISLKSGIKFKGLINVSGFHVDPGFEGNLIYSVFNAGPSPIHIARGDPLFLLWIADIDGNSDPKYFKTDKFPQSEISTKLVSEVAREVQSVQRISERLEKTEHRINVIWYSAIILATIAALAFAFIQILPDGAVTRIAHALGGS